MNVGEQSSAADLRRLIVGYRLSQALHVAARLGVADLLQNGPMSVDELARPVGADPESLYRLMRLLASDGVFAESERRRFELTPLAMPLRSDVPGSLRARTIFDCEEAHWQAWGNLMHSVATGEPAFDRTHGVLFFEYMKTHAAVAANFNAVMTDQNAAAAQAVVEAYDFSGLATLVDVGGGHGSLLAAILAAYPPLRGILHDQAHVVATARPTLQAAGVADRCDIIAGDFFEAVPAGGHAYLLKHILHNWDEPRCAAILSNARQAMPADGRLLVIETLIPPDDEPSYGKYLDLGMLVLLPGRERTKRGMRSCWRRPASRSLASSRRAPSSASWRRYLRDRLSRRRGHRDHGRASESVTTWPMRPSRPGGGARIPTVAWTIRAAVAAADLEIWLRARCRGRPRAAGRPVYASRAEPAIATGVG